MRSAPSTLLGGLTPQQFLSDYWQKKPLLVRQAIADFRGITALQSWQDMLSLVCRDSAEARLVSRQSGRWQLDEGPFMPRDFKRLGANPWTVLLQGANLLLPEADRLMRRFDFIPQARLDDLMVSYAVDGGGVGPHFDNYDVFLLQGIGQRRWRIGAQRDKTLIDGLPLKILADFRPSQEWLLQPGDMLYLPPQWAHDGSAVGDCMTYSIGFRAPPVQELAEEFLMHLQDHLVLPGRYSDPDLRHQQHSAEIAAPMIDQVDGMLAKLRWNRATVRDFLGCTLTDPKAQVVFAAPSRPLSRQRFAERCARQGLRLDIKTQLLFAGTRFYINGDPCAVAAADRKALRQLADQRELEACAKLSEAALDTLHVWYCDGFLELR